MTHQIRTVIDRNSVGDDRHAPRGRKAPPFSRFRVSANYIGEP